jgi:hypothetical protein
MLGTILKGRLVTSSFPLAAAYLCLLSLYGPFGKPWPALAALLFPLFAVMIGSRKIHMASLLMKDGQQDAREAEVIACWSGIAICVVVFLTSWPEFHGGAIGSLVAVGAFGRRLRAPTK